MVTSAPKNATTNERVPFSRATLSVMAALTAIAMYNVVELNVQIFIAFKRRRGLYFWSLVITSWGCFLHALGFLLKFFHLANPYVFCSIVTLGWYCMVTGQSVVLYSRLHLVVRDERILRGVLIMIIVDAFCFHIPTTILTYGINTADWRKYYNVFNVYEKIQMTAFCLQEIIISSIYVWATVNLLKPVSESRTRTRQVMMKLIWVNLIIIAMDAVLLGMEYSNYYDVETTMKAMIYSIKLKLEFTVLNQLMTLASRQMKANQNLHIDDTKPANIKPPPPGRSKSIEYTSYNYIKRPEQTKKSERWSQLWPRKNAVPISYPVRIPAFQSLVTR